MDEEKIRMALHSLRMPTAMDRPPEQHSPSPLTHTSHDLSVGVSQNLSISSGERPGEDRPSCKFNQPDELKTSNTVLHALQIDQS
ncbi:hypothetical protein PGTUg99_001656 [Puccinia graminis f. sp. tritici]|uniref:Uncharacterized protein n=1 Tax=Puccinia graminis f. sp. tritici TaxID=56615 RepID=A0A5B0RDV1_PUCGR|nr:hypothetical protein PGTUg99_001656 [Puccinia graminis f. sp. tritici]